MNILSGTGVIFTPEITQAVHNVLYDLLQLALLAIAAGVSYAVKLCINHLGDGWKARLASRAVKYAEQKFVTNPERLQEAVSVLKTYLPRLSEDEINHLIEEAVANLQKPNTINIQADATVTNPAVAPPVPTGSATPPAN